MMSKHSSPARKQDGVAAVELAIVTGLLLVLALGVAEYARAVYLYNTLAKSARDAARYLSLQAANVHVAEAKKLAVFGNVAGSGSALAPGLSTDKVAVCDAVSCPGDHSLQPTTRGTINLVTVTISQYSYAPLLSFMATGFTFSPISVTMPQVL